MDPELLDFELPPDRIAQAPAARRDDSRLLVVDRSRDSVRDERFVAVGEHLRPGDLLVLNDTRVVPSRITGSKSSGGRVEVTILDPMLESAEHWALVRSSSRHRVGQRFAFPHGLAVEITELHPDGPVRLRVVEGDLHAALEAEGRMPLPPYIRRSGTGQERDERDPMDRERYQTVVAVNGGAVAAPTAGLHFTEPLLDELERRGIERTTITLHVGYGSFQPIRTARVEDHRLHPERYEVSETAASRISQQRSRGGRIVAVGTTVVRTLESLMDEAGRVRAGRGSTGLMILPGHTFRAVDVLITNFHHPRTTLLALAQAFGGVERIRRAYAHALEAGYRFLSYGDAMLIV